MCSLSWIRQGGDLHLFFNRDEQLSRPAALPPQVDTIGDTQVLLPVDPQAGGTWISVNEYGVIVALLNSYQDSDRLRHLKADQPNKKPVSRGLLVRDLSVYHNVAAAHQALQALDLSVYEPFTLFVLDRESALKHYWNGQQCEVTDAPPFYASSGFDSAGVIRTRQQDFNNLSAPDMTTLRKLHYSHHHADGAYNVCMHREDAATRNFSAISVTKDMITFDHTSGAPCQTECETYYLDPQSFTSKSFTSQPLHQGAQQSNAGRAI